KLKYMDRSVLSNKIYLDQSYIASAWAAVIPANMKNIARPMASALLLKILEIMKANDSLLPNINIQSQSLHTVHRLYAEQVHRLFNITGDKLKQNQLGFFITAADYSFLSVIHIEKSAQLHHILADDRR